ncbi:lytic transglycosylase [Izhakiella capsodis]|nr:lytic transglycosylase [Izhakiella capsodis]
MRKFQSVLTGVTANVLKMGATVEGAALSVVGFTTKIAAGLDKLWWSSQRTGSTVAGMKALTFAAAQTGSSAEAAQGALESLARFVRNNPGAEGFFNRLGVQTRDASGNMRDMSTIFTGVGQKLSQMPYYRANQYAQMLGIDENTLMAMRRGLGQFSAQYTQMAAAIGFDADRAAASSNRFMTSLRSFSQLAGLARDKIGSNFAGGLAGSLDSLRKRVIENFPKIEKVITSGVKDLLAMADAITRVIFRLIQAAADIEAWWTTLGKGTRQLIEVFGGLLIAWRLLNTAILTSPFGIITMLGASLLALYDDYETWKEGGQSLIDWGKWEPDIQAALKNIRELMGSIKKLSDEVLKLFAIDPKKWTVKWEFENLSQNLGELGKMLNLIGDLLNALNEGRWADAAGIGKQLLKQGSEKPDAIPGVTKSAMDTRKWILKKYGAANDALNRYLPEWIGGAPAPRGIRNNNPGNLNFVGQKGAEIEKTGGRFARFQTPFDGLRAMSRQLTLYAGRGINTIEKIINKWAPGNENNTGAYIKAISQQLGIAPDALLNLHNPKIMSSLMDGIVQHENGRNPYSSELISRAAVAGMGGNVQQETTINVYGATDPAATGMDIAGRQTSVNARLIGQTKQRAY